MTKVLVKTKLINGKDVLNNKTVGILKENQLLFKEQKFKVNISWQENRITLTREDKKVKMKFNFELNKITDLEYHIKKFSNLILKTKLIDCEIKDRQILIKYEIIDGDKIEYQIKWEDLK